MYMSRHTSTVYHARKKRPTSRHGAAATIQKWFKRRLATRYDCELQNARDTDPITLEPVYMIPRRLLYRHVVVNQGQSESEMHVYGYHAIALLQWLAVSSTHPITRTDMSLEMDHVRAAVARFLEKDPLFRKPYLERELPAQQARIRTMQERANAALADYIKSFVPSDLQSPISSVSDTQSSPSFSDVQSPTSPAEVDYVALRLQSTPSPSSTGIHSQESTRMRRSFTNRVDIRDAVPTTMSFAALVANTFLPSSSSVVEYHALDHRFPKR